MSYIEKLTEQLKRHEGDKRKPYRDSEGILTIGIGRNLEDKGLSIKEREFLCQNDISDAVLDVRAILGSTADRMEKYYPVRFAVLVNMAFNMGSHRLSGFKKMIAALKTYTPPIWDVVAAEMLDSRWARQVGRRAEELAEQMRTGEWVK